MSSSTLLSTSSDLSAALPEGFPFYHLGRVSTEREIDSRHEFKPEEELIDSVAIGYQLLGEMRGWVVILVDRGLDMEMYSEMGNILASRFATEISKKLEGDVLISPPRQIPIATLEKQLRATPPSASRLYWHVFEGRTLPIRTLVIGEGAQT